MYSSERSTRKIDYMYMPMYKYIRHSIYNHTPRTYVDIFFVSSVCALVALRAISVTQYPQGEGRTFGEHGC